MADLNDDIRMTVTRRRPLVALLLLAGLGATAGVTGCARKVFAEEAPRTQYELHDRMRNEYVPLTERDVFGNPQPALRARLSRR